MEMLTERQTLILEKLNSYGKVSVLELAEEYKVTSATIRRDLSLLEEHQKLQRVHGGAVKISFISEEPSFDDRFKLYLSEKKGIANIAASLISDHMSVFIDVGTTTAQMVPFLLNKRSITVFTNAFDIASALSRQSKNGLFTGKIIFIGGEVNTKQRTVSGSFSLDMLKQLYFDMAFIGVGGVHLTGGFTGYDVNEVYLSRVALQQAKESIVLLDHTKIGVRNLHQIAQLSSVDRIICDTDCPHEWKKELERMNIEWLY